MLDPRNVTIYYAANGSFDSGRPNTFTPSDDSSAVDVSTIASSLSGGTDVAITLIPMEFRMVTYQLQLDFAA